MRERRATQRRRGGFSLIETVAAIVVLAISMPPMLWSIGEAQSLRVNPILSSRARWLAVEGSPEGL